jgi:NO-binding membrane sensor protein with MHYT domain
MKYDSLITLISLVVTIIFGAIALTSQQTLEMKLLSIEGISLIVIAILVFKLYIDKYVEDVIKTSKRKK